MKERERSICYLHMLSSFVALYWEGISINAATTNSISSRDAAAFFDIISVKFTNWKSTKIKGSKVFLFSNWTNYKQKSQA